MSQTVAIFHTLVWFRCHVWFVFFVMLPILGIFRLICVHSSESQAHLTVIISHLIQACCSKVEAYLIWYRCGHFFAVKIDRNKTIGHSVSHAFLSRSHFHVVYVAVILKQNLYVIETVSLNEIQTVNLWKHTQYCKRSIRFTILWFIFWICSADVICLT